MSVTGVTASNELPRSELLNDSFCNPIANIVDITTRIDKSTGIKRNFFSSLMNSNNDVNSTERRISIGKRIP